MPAGSGMPLGETPNVPPLRTPLGSVVESSSFVAVPAAKKRGPTFHCAGAGAGLGAGVGAGVGAGLGAGAGVGSSADAGWAVSSLLPPQALSKTAQP
jgi:hypothetical protein